MAPFFFDFFPVILVQLMIISVLDSASNPNVTDLTALLDFKNRITDDPLGIMASWNNSSDYCNWKGITCDPFNRRVRTLDLRSSKLVGSLPPSISNLSFLTGINLRNNSFRGEIPQEIGLLSSLKHLNLTYNVLSGFIPSHLSNCTELTVLALEYNQLSGQIPGQLSSLSKLELLGVGGNNLTGSFPAWIGNFSSRFFGLSLALNSFHGSIPPEIGRLSGLTFFQIYGNQFSGELPSSIYNLSLIKFFSVTQNRLHGEIPSDIGLKYPNVEIFAGGVNNFTGGIPVSLANASRLGLVDFANNSLTGAVPSVLGSLPFLYRINFDVNLLGNGGTGDMNFLSSLTNCTNLEVLGLYGNLFGGKLPAAVANLSTKLQILTLGGNKMHGDLAVGIGNLENLTLLGLEGNYFTGRIPDDLGKLQRLGGLHLTGNGLTGMIPFSLGNLTSLSELYLDSNRLQGNIPPQLGNMTHLLELSLNDNNLTGTIPKEIVSLSSLSVGLGLARNSLSGPLPAEVSKLTNLKELDVSENKLSGAIPTSLGRCVSLEILLVGGNQFTGTIPESLQALRGLEEIDFSHNNLSGKIPEFLGKLPFIRKLNLSYNNLEGEVSNQGVFSNASSDSVIGNERLCGGAPSLRLPACSVPAKKSNKDLKLRWIIPVIVSFALSIVLVCSLSLCYISRMPKNITASSLNEMQQGISYQEVYRSTNGFSADNLIGSGSFGSVYRGIFGENSSLVAVKVLDLRQKGAIQSFIDEGMILKNIRHRNLLKIITLCSSLDHLGQEFKCLVTELMVNGSLDVWLHPSKDARNTLPTKTFNIIERLNIAIDVASALDYLHNHCHTPIVHCDLKPNNILLDKDFTAHVADFGLSKFLLKATNMPLKDAALSVGLKGSIGYIPPEYGTSSEISTLGDVYSYGIVVLELFTGKRPTDDMFNNGLTIHKYVAMTLPERVMEVLDPSLILAGEEERETTDHILAANKTEFQQFGSGEMDCLVSVLRLGLSCSMPSPRNRMPIGIVVNQLHSIRDQLRRATKE
ncbi:hypothetical protein C2S52_006671 [Perilla frutescens var. hirtella]|nr:hypothetical protein C2S52_006671 [Perilla frutescens var. hirtella]